MYRSINDPLLPPAVDLHADQHDIHTKIQPEHKEDQGGQASIHAVGVTILYIDGEAE